MQLIIGTICISLAVFTFCIVLIGFRNPKQPFWASDSLVGNFHSIVILAFGLVGILTIGGALFKYSAVAVSHLHIAISAMILVATAIGVKAMQIKKRLAEFERQIGNMPRLVYPSPTDAKKGSQASNPKIAA